MKNKLKIIEKNIKYKFTNTQYLTLALTHKSSSSEHNERLEFLGDSILSLAITAEIYNKFIQIYYDILIGTTFTTFTAGVAARNRDARHRELMLHGTPGYDSHAHIQYATK